MAKETQDPPEDLKDQSEGEADLSQDPPETQDPPEDQKEKDQDPEVRKAIQRRDAAIKRAQKAEEEAKALREKYEEKDQDPEVKANRKLIRAEARVVMTGKGITDPDDQKTLASFLDLDSVTVSGDGDVDSDTITERLEALERILGKPASSGRRTPRVDVRDRGGEKATPPDAAKARRRAMLLGR